MVEQLVPDLFLKKKNLAYHWINSLKFYIVFSIVYPSGELSKYIKTKVQTTCFHLIEMFFKKQK